jgi:hypothetical protein
MRRCIWLVLLLVASWTGAGAQLSSLLAALQADPELSTLTQLVSRAGLNATLLDTATVVSSTASRCRTHHAGLLWLPWMVENMNRGGWCA